MCSAPRKCSYLAIQETANSLSRGEKDEVKLSKDFGFQHASGIIGVPTATFVGPSFHFRPTCNLKFRSYKINTLDELGTLHRMLNRPVFHHGFTATAAVANDERRPSERRRNECAIRYDSWRLRTRPEPEFESNSKLNLLIFM